MFVIGIFFLFLDVLNFLCLVLRIGASEERSVGCLTKPVRTCSELIREVFVVVHFWLFVHVFLGVGTLASERERSSCMLVSWLHILIVSLIPWELRRVGADVGRRAVAVQEVFGVGSVEFISKFTSERLSVYGINVKMGALQAIVFLVIFYNIGHLFLEVKATLVCGGLSKVRFDHIHLALMPAAVAFLAKTLLMMFEVRGL